jgi:hypothetical protein
VIYIDGSFIKHSIPAMPIYITVLDDLTGKSLVAYGPALVDGLRPADFSYEYLGEVMA